MLEVLEEEFEINISRENYHYIDNTWNGLLIYLNKKTNIIYGYSLEEEICKFKCELLENYQNFRFKLSNNGVYFVILNNINKEAKIIDLDKKEIIDELNLSHLDYDDISISFEFKSRLILFYNQTLLNSNFEQIKDILEINNQCYYYNIEKKELKNINIDIYYGNNTKIDLNNPDKNYIFEGNHNFVLSYDIITLYHDSNKKFYAKNINYKDFFIINIRKESDTNNSISYSINSFKTPSNNILNYEKSFIDNRYIIPPISKMFIVDEKINYFDNDQFHEMKFTKDRNNNNIVVIESRMINKNIYLDEYTHISMNGRILIDGLKVFKYHNYYHNQINNQKLLEIWNNYQDFELINDNQPLGENNIKVNLFLFKKYSKTMKDIIEDLKLNDIDELNIQIDKITNVEKMFLNLFNGFYSHPYIRRYLGIESTISNQRINYLTLLGSINNNINYNYYITYNNILIYYYNEYIIGTDLKNFDNIIFELKCGDNIINKYLFNVSNDDKYLIYRNERNIIIYDTEKLKEVKIIKLNEIEPIKNSTYNLSFIYDFNRNYILFFYEDYFKKVNLYNIETNELISFNINYDDSKSLSLKQINKNNIYFFTDEIIFEYSNNKLNIYDNDQFNYKLRYIDENNFVIFCHDYSKRTLHKAINSLNFKLYSDNFQYFNTFFVKNDIDYFPEIYNNSINSLNDGNLIKRQILSDKNHAVFLLNKNPFISSNGNYFIYNELIFKHDIYYDNIFDSETLIEFYKDKNYQDFTITNNKDSLKVNKVLLSAYSKLISDNIDKDEIIINAKIEDVNQMFLNIFNNVKDHYYNLREYFQIIS